MKPQHLSRKTLQSLSKLSYMLGVAFVIASLLVNAMPLQGAYAEASNTKGDNPGHCFGNEPTIKDENGGDGWEIHAPEGYVFTDAMVKASTDCYSDGDLYEIEGIGTSTVTASRLCAEGPECPEISHLEGTYALVTPPAPPDLDVKGKCLEDGGAAFTVTNYGGDMTEPANWEVNTGASGSLQLASLTFADYGPYGYDQDITFTVYYGAGLSASDTAYCASPGEPALTVVGSCGEEGAQFVVTNIGADMEESVSWHTTTGASGTLILASGKYENFGPYGFDETVTFTVDFKDGISADAYCETTPEPPVLSTAGMCTDDGTAQIMVKNTSEVDMTESAGWELYVNNKVEEDGDVLLAAGESKQMEFDYPNKEIKFVLQAPKGELTENLECKLNPPKPRFDDCYHPLKGNFTLYVKNDGEAGYIGYLVQGESALSNLGIFSVGETKSLEVGLLHNDPDTLLGSVSLNGVDWEESGVSHTLNPTTAKLCPYDKPVLEGYCTNNKPGIVFWSVKNANNYDVTYIWKWNSLTSEAHLRTVTAKGKDDFSTDYFNGNLEIWSAQGDILFATMKAPFCQAPPTETPTQPVDTPTPIPGVTPTPTEVFTPPTTLAPAPAPVPATGGAEPAVIIPVTGIADGRAFKSQALLSAGFGFIGLGLVFQGLSARKREEE